MKGIDSAQTLITQFADELQNIGEQMYAEFQVKQADLEKLINDSKTSQTILKIKQDELSGLYKRIQDFAASMETDIHNKQVELLEPFQKQLLEAVSKVAKAGSYNYIFDISTLLFYAPNDDLTNQVKEQIGIK